MAKTAGQIGDGLMSTTPMVHLSKLLKRRRVRICRCIASPLHAMQQLRLRRRRLRINSGQITGIPGELDRELPVPKFFEATASLVTEEQATADVACGSDPKSHLEAIKVYLDAGFKKVSFTISVLIKRNSSSSTRKK